MLGSNQFLLSTAGSVKTDTQTFKTNERLRKFLSAGDTRPSVVKYHTTEKRDCICCCCHLPNPKAFHRFRSNHASTPDAYGIRGSETARKGSSLSRRCRDFLFSRRSLAAFFRRSTAPQTFARRRWRCKLNNVARSFFFPHSRTPSFPLSPPHFLPFVYPLPPFSPTGTPDPGSQPRALLVRAYSAL